MPTSAEILAGLSTIANEWIVLAIAWHVVLAVALGAAAMGWRPTSRATSRLVALLPASAAVAALAHRSPFNGVVLAATSLALVALAARDRRGPVRRVPRWRALGGAAMIAFGWAYPHFVDGGPLVYLYAAPVGLVPCPTLAVTIGLALVTGAGDRAWRLTLAGVGAFYAGFGVARLGVTLDLGLLAGAALLAAAGRGRVSTGRHSAAVNTASATCQP